MLQQNNESWVCIPTFLDDVTMIAAIGLELELAHNTLTEKLHFGSTNSISISISIKCTYFNMPM